MSYGPLRQQPWQKKKKIKRGLNPKTEQVGNMKYRINTNSKSLLTNK